MLNNHDQVRTVTRYGEPAPEGSGLGAARARAAALLMLALPGAAYIYQGEELGLPEVVDLPDDVLTDPIFRRTGSRARIRDGCRVPLPWSGQASPFGFTSGAEGAKPWLPQPEYFAEYATHRALADTRSSWHLYRDGLQLRSALHQLGEGTLRWLDTQPGVLAFARDDLVCAVNFGTAPVPAPVAGTPLLASGPCRPGSCPAPPPPGGSTAPEHARPVNSRNSRRDIDDDATTYHPARRMHRTRPRARRDRLRKRRTRRHLAAATRRSAARPSPWLSVWSGSEQENFQKVLDAFTEKTGAKTQFVSTGDNVSTVVGSKIEGGNAPDVVMVPQVGVLKQFADQGWLKPLDKKVQSAVGANFAEVWRNYGSVDGTLYGLYFKAAHKSTVWYSPEALEQVSVAEPKTYDEMLKNGRTVSDSGLAAFSVAGQDGWTLTDWFENVYLSQAGPEKYDALAAHEIKWTDPTVVQALTTLGKLFKDKQLIAGGQKGALNTDFPARWRRSSDPRPRPPWSTRATSW